MAKYRSIIITEDGLNLISSAHTGDIITFTAIKTGNGVYEDSEDVSKSTELKSFKQSFGIASVTRDNATVKVRSVINNEGVTEGYSVTEIGLFARNPQTNTEILYSIIIAEQGLEDYLPVYEDAPASITLEVYISAANTESVTFTAEIVEGTYATVADLTEHTQSTDNPHSVTKAQVGLGSVPNVATNDQTPTYTVATSNTALTSGEKLSVAFGKIAKAVSSLISHLTNTGNPHSVTKEQVGLGSVPNVATNDQTPTYAAASSNAALTSGEKLSTAFGKLAKAVSSLISHLANTSNPHSVTAAQVGLGSVPNVTTNGQTPTYTVASSNTELSSGENLSTAFGKIAKAVSSLISHLANKSNPHAVTASQVGAVAASETNGYNFTNKNINSINIDEVYNYNYVTSISEGGHGTVPSGGWLNIINFYSTHFCTQLAFSCENGTVADRSAKMWIRERYAAGGISVWSTWRMMHNVKTITAGTTDLTAGISALETGTIYFVYE